MTTRNSGLHRYTPTLSVIDPRGLVVRTITCHRRAVEEPIAERVQRQVFNAKGLLCQQWGPRLGDMSDLANQSMRYSLSGQVLLNESVENASQTIGPGLPGLEIFGPVDDSRWRTYSQTYSYDSGGNLTQLKHDAGTGNRYTREMVVDARSNRSLFKDGSPIDFAKAFDANGNQQALAPGPGSSANPVEGDIAGTAAKPS